MLNKYTISVLTLLFTIISDINGCAPCVTLNEGDFDKVTSRFPEVFIKFDVAFTYGQKYGYFSILSYNYSYIDDLLFVEVFVQKYRGNRNQALADRFEVGPNDYPTFRFVKRGRKGFDRFPKWIELSQESLKDFLLESTGFNLNRTGCLKNFDKFAKSFMDAEEDREDIFKKAEQKSARLKNEKQFYSKIYLNIMKRILKDGEDYLENELKQTKKQLEEEVDVKTKKHLERKLNILKSFKDDPSDEEENRILKHFEEFEEEIQDEELGKDEL